MQPRRVWRGGTSHGCHRVIALLASGIRMVIILPQDDISVVGSLGVPFSHTVSIHLSGSAPPPRVKHCNAMNGSTRDSLDSARDNGNWNEKKVGESGKD